MLVRQYKAFRFGRHIDRRGPFAVSLPEVRIGRLGRIWPPRCGIRTSSEGCCPTLPFFWPLQWCPPPNLLIGHPLLIEIRGQILRLEPIVRRPPPRRNRYTQWRVRSSHNSLNLVPRPAPDGF